MRTLSRFRLHLSVPSESPCMEPSWGLFCWKYIYFSIRFLWFQLSTGVLRLSGRWMIDASPCSCRPSSTLSPPSHSNQRSRNVTTSFLVSHLSVSPDGLSLSLHFSTIFRYLFSPAYDILTEVLSYVWPFFQFYHHEFVSRSNTFL